MWSPTLWQRRVMFMSLLTVSRSPISRRGAEDFFLSPILTLAVKISHLSRNMCEIFLLLSAVKVTDLTCTA
jgi:hypothetical protein